MKFNDTIKKKITSTNLTFFSFEKFNFNKPKYPNKKAVNKQKHQKQANNTEKDKRHNTKTKTIYKSLKMTNTFISFIFKFK